MKKNKTLKKIMVSIILIISFFQIAAQNVESLKSITFEDGTEFYTWDIWGNNGVTDAFTVIDNPDQSGVNTSLKAGQYTCLEGSNSWAGMNIHDSVLIAITDTNKFFSMDVRKQDISKVVMALEKGNGAVTRFDAYPTNTKINEWETMVFDFTEVVGDTFYRLTIQPDLVDADPRPGAAVVLLDNIKWHRDNPLMATPLRTITFEPEGQDYSWVTFDNPVDANDPNSFSIVDNPDPSGINKSSKVGKYESHTGALPWAGVKTDELAPIVISDDTKWFSMDVYKTSTNNVGLKVEGGRNGLQKDCFVSPETTGRWEKLIFDFSSVVGDTFPTFVVFPDWSQDNPRIDEAISYFDNIRWSKDAPVVVQPLNPITFEEGTDSYEWLSWGNTGDTATLIIVDNPAVNWKNQSGKAGRFICHTGSNSWAGMNIMDSVEIKITDENKYFTMDVLKDHINKVVMALEQGDGDVTRFDAYPYNTKTGEWETLVFDFSSVIGKTFYKLTIQPDLSESDPRTDSTVVYLDNINWTATYPASIDPLEEITFEDGSTTYDWNVWGNNGDSEAFTIVDNPSKEGVNTSDKAGRYICHAGSNNWAGMNINKQVEITITEDNKFFTMDVNKSGVNKVVIALEEGQGTIDRIDAYPYNTLTGEWETLVFDFSEAVGNTFLKLTIQPDLTENDPRTDSSVVYLDNIKWYAEDPTLGLFEQTDQQVKLYPNPALNELRICSSFDLSRAYIYDINGRQIRTLLLDGMDASVSVSDLTHGLYFIKICGPDHVINRKFLKE